MVNGDECISFFLGRGGLVCAEMVPAEPLRGLVQIFFCIAVSSILISERDMVKWPPFFEEM